ncbi:MAG: methylated-DNA--[protein]-cysteine S-methyltransferase [Planctomycetota bacterium]
MSAWTRGLPTELLRALRFVKQRDELRRGATTSVAQWAAGFTSSRAIYEHASSYLGGSPGTWSQVWRGKRKLMLRYGIAPCRWGLALIGWTERGVATVLLGDGVAELEAMLREQLNGTSPKSEVVLERSHESAPHVDAVIAHLNSVNQAAGVELDPSGTEFQLTVWRALREIPPGETRTYSEVASMMGRPTAVRAVATACARNPLAVLIPCHRVVPSAGGTGQYRWGTTRKEELLEEEESLGSADSRTDLE